MALLYVDTAMNACVAAVQSGGGVTARAELMHRGQAEMLAPFMAHVMQQGGVSFDRLKAVAVTIGPGTFTGLRVGMSAAKGVALARNLPVIGLTTLDIIAAQVAAQAEGRGILVVIESKRSDFYCQYFDADGQPKATATALEAAEIHAAHCADRLVVCGDANERLRTDIEAAGLPWPDSWDTTECLYPDPAAALRLAAAKLSDGSVHGMPQPLYLRGADVSQPKIKRIIEG